jgi:RNA polymerase sigma factor (sigma-70 family)
MEAVLSNPPSAAVQDREIAATVARERGRLLAFIRRRVADAAEAEDLLQDTLYELVAARRLMQPVGHAAAWLTRVARNRIVDRYRKKRPERLADAFIAGDAADEDEGLEDLLPAADGGPETAVMRAMLLAEVEVAVAELAPEQRAVFLAHELDGVSFKELSRRTGVSVNTLLSRKHAAVRYLRERLRAVWNDWLTD